MADFKTQWLAQPTERNLIDTVSAYLHVKHSKVRMS